MKTIVDRNEGSLANLNDQVKKKDVEINELNGKLQKLNSVMEELKKPNGDNDMTGENKLQNDDKPSYEWEVDMAYLEKKTQDQDHQLFLAEEELVKMRETWDADKMRMMDYKNRYC